MVRQHRDDPRFYVEQGRGTVLGGAPEAFLFNYGAFQSTGRSGKGRGPEDVAALMLEMPQHFELARLIHGKRPRGLLGWKPANSSPGADFTLHPLLGMAGFPLTAACEFDASAEGFVFGCHVLKDPALVGRRRGRHGVRPAHPRDARVPEDDPSAGGGQPHERRSPAREGRRGARADERYAWPAMESLPPAELDALRDRAMSSIGSFHAPHGVSSTSSATTWRWSRASSTSRSECALSLEGWGGFSEALRIPAEGAYAVSGGATARITLPARRCWRCGGYDPSLRPCPSGRLRFPLGAQAGAGKRTSE